jgi:hypothetical protein
MYLAHPVSLGAAAVFLLAGVLVYRRRGREDKQHGSQGAVILIVIGAILAIYGLGLMEYRPSQGEIDRSTTQRTQ